MELIVIHLFPPLACAGRRVAGARRRNGERGPTATLQDPSWAHPLRGGSGLGVSPGLLVSPMLVWCHFRPRASLVPFCPHACLIPFFAMWQDYQRRFSWVFEFLN